MSGQLVLLVRVDQERANRVASVKPDATPEEISAVVNSDNNAAAQIFSMAVSDLTPLLIIFLFLQVLPIYVEPHFRSIL